MFRLYTCSHHFAGYSTLKKNYKIQDNKTVGPTSRLHSNVQLYRTIKRYPGADKSLARHWKETSYSDQDLQHYTKTYGVQTTGIYSCGLYTVSLGHCNLFPSSVGLRPYQHPCTCKHITINNQQDATILIYLL